MSTQSATETDVVVIGAGHNGLTTAGYLARRGLSVTVVEARDVVGGAALTEEFHPGFRNSVYSYVVSLLHPSVIAELDLARHGLEILDRPSGSFCPQPDGRYLLVSRDSALAKREIAKFSTADADRFDAFEAEVESVAPLVRKLAARPAPNLGGGLGDLWAAAGTANDLRRLGAAGQATLWRLMTSSIGDYLDGWFESDALKGNFGYEGIIGNMVSPYAQGSAYVLLHHVFGENAGKTGAWGHARGGMGAITQAMARSAAAAGARIETGAPVAEVETRDGHASGVVLGDGRRIAARAVASSVNPKLLFGRLVDPALLPDDFRRRMAAWRCRSGTFRMNVALSELPRFTGLPAPEAARAAFLQGTINLAPSLGHLERAYDDARRAGWAREPVISMCLPSTLDDSLAPPGRHVASLFCQHFNPDLPDGGDWDTVREAVADHVIATVDRYAPGFAASVLGRQIKTPKDLERDLGLVGGDIFHGALHLDQLF
ncbi:MAG: FAD-dependent oxidoreductase, partial [Alphaproteobacteria bacterium]|nr:FAD-dependent oxidoreductase [Alphaproteobacteria bacterium]